MTTLRMGSLLLVTFGMLEGGGYLTYWNHKLSTSAKIAQLINRTAPCLLELSIICRPNSFAVNSELENLAMSRVESSTSKNALLYIIVEVLVNVSFAGWSIYWPSVESDLMRSPRPYVCGGTCAHLTSVLLSLAVDEWYVYTYLPSARLASVQALACFGSA